jgi:hypothetical protein
MHSCVLCIGVERRRALRDVFGVHNPSLMVKATSSPTTAGNNLPEGMRHKVEAWNCQLVRSACPKTFFPRATFERTAAARIHHAISPQWPPEFRDSERSLCGALAEFKIDSVPSWGRSRIGAALARPGVRRAACSIGEAGSSRPRILPLVGPQPVVSLNYSLARLE